jgi:uncharacterized hydrophobic protein (TIGR00271 family)
MQTCPFDFRGVESMSSPSHSLHTLLSLRRDQASPQAIDSTIRDGVHIGGTNLWVLMAAILIASIGLNVNSTAVIIGAMLISPLMAPIIGAGYGAGIQDAGLIRNSLRSLAVFALISLGTSTLYFVISPLTNAQSELLARTSPTIWDVLIAFFGGAAGMIGLTRREKTTLIPGVAIATALMPPLCTAGYGLATGQPRFFFGAFYLFTINGVFIALATLTITRVLRLPVHANSDGGAQHRRALWIGAIVTAALLPSIYLAAQLVGDEWFNTRAHRFLSAQETSHKDLVILARGVDPRQRRIEVTVLGGGSATDLTRILQVRLSEFGLSDATLEVRKPSEGISPRESESAQGAASQDVLRKALLRLEHQAARISVLERQAREAENDRILQSQLAGEIQAQLPAAQSVSVASTASTDIGKRALVIVLGARRPLPAGDVARLKQWLGIRLSGTAYEVVLGNMPP